MRAWSTRGRGLLGLGGSREGGVLGKVGGALRKGRGLELTCGRGFFEGRGYAEPQKVKVAGGGA